MASLTQCLILFTLMVLPAITHAAVVEVDSKGVGVLEDAEKPTRQKGENRDNDNDLARDSMVRQHQEPTTASSTKPLMSKKDKRKQGTMKISPQGEVTPDLTEVVQYPDSEGEPDLPSAEEQEVLAQLAQKQMLAQQQIFAQDQQQMFAQQEIAAQQAATAQQAAAAQQAGGAQTAAAQQAAAQQRMGYMPHRNNQNGDGTDGLGSGQNDNEDSDQGVSLLGSGGKATGKMGKGFGLSLRRRYYGPHGGGHGILDRRRHYGGHGVGGVAGVINTGVPGMINTGVPGVINTGVPGVINTGVIGTGVIGTGVIGTGVIDSHRYGKGMHHHHHGY